MMILFLEILPFVLDLMCLGVTSAGDVTGEWSVENSTNLRYFKKKKK